jgi:hypothetical protein
MVLHFGKRMVKVWRLCDGDEFRAQIFSFEQMFI